MAGLQFLGTLPRQPGVGTQLGEAIRGGTEAFLAQRSRLEDLQYRKETQALAAKEVSLKEKSLTQQTDESMQRVLLEYHKSLSLLYQINPNDPVIAKQFNDSTRLLEQKLGIPAAALAQPGEDSARKARLSQVDKRIKGEGGGQSALYKAASRMSGDPEAEGKIFTAFGGPDLMDEEAEGELRQKIKDALLTRRTDVSSPAFQAGSKMIKGIQTGISNIPVSRALALAEKLGLPVPSPTLEDVGRLLPTGKDIFEQIGKIPGQFIRGATYGAPKER